MEPPVFVLSTVRCSDNLANGGHPKGSPHNIFATVESSAVVVVAATRGNAVECRILHEKWLS